MLNDVAYEVGIVKCNKKKWCKCQMGCMVRKKNVISYVLGVEVTPPKEYTQ